MIQSDIRRITTRIDYSESMTFAGLSPDDWKRPSPLWSAESIDQSGIGISTAQNYKYYRKYLEFGLLTVYYASLRITGGMVYDTNLK